MKTTTFTNAIVAAVLMSGLVSAAFALTATESSGIVFMKQEEKLACDVLQVFYAK